MSRRSLPLASLAIALSMAGCGGDAKEDAPALGTAAAIALAPPNAMGGDVPRPAPRAAEVPIPGRKGTPKGLAPLDPLDDDDPPLPPGAGDPPAKGTDL